MTASGKTNTRTNPRTAARWPEGTRVRSVTSGWTGAVERVLSATSGSGAVRVRWDEKSRASNPFAEETSVVSNPGLELEREWSDT